MIDLDYDEPLWRPPSEGDNLILQATLGCSFNGCTFCSMYKSKRFLARPLEAVFSDIDLARAQWPGAQRVFLADGDALTLPTEHLLALLDRLNKAFPDLTRVSAYATPANLLKKGPQEMARLRERKLTLLYVGIESGAPSMLRRIRKGATAKSMHEAFEIARESGVKISATVILGLGGRAHWREHIEGTADFINQTPPNFLSTLQLRLAPDVEGRFFEKFGEPFAPQDDLGMLEEQRLLLERLSPPRPVIFRSNHASNALALAGTLPKDKEKLLALLGKAQTGEVRLRPRFVRGL
jgi:radical SAM superfamily enzyme YgiQ (UPF0313 family)